MIPAERQAYIYHYACQYELVTISKLAEELSVSEMTIRRDIQVLEKEGKIITVSGGIKVKRALLREPSLHEKLVMNRDIKEIIGIEAARLVQPKQTLYLDAGTTTFEIAKQLLIRNNNGDFPNNDSLEDSLTIISNDFTIIHYLMNQSNFSLFHTGGEIDQRNASGVGPLAAQFIDNFNIDLAFISTSSWDLKHGISTPSEAKVAIKQRLLQSVCQTILVTDSSKYSEYSRFKIASLDQFDQIITDNQLPRATIKKIKQLGIEITLVQALES